MARSPESHPRVIDRVAGSLLGRQSELVSQEKAVESRDLQNSLQELNEKYSLDLDVKSLVDVLGILRKDKDSTYQSILRKLGTIAIRDSKGPREDLSPILYEVLQGSRDRIVDIENEIRRIDEIKERADLVGIPVSSYIEEIEDFDAYKKQLLAEIAALRHLVSGLDEKTQALTDRFVRMYAGKQERERAAQQRETEINSFVARNDFESYLSKKNGVNLAEIRRQYIDADSGDPPIEQYRKYHSHLSRLFLSILYSEAATSFVESSLDFTDFTTKTFSVEGESQAVGVTDLANRGATVKQGKEKMTPQEQQAAAEVYEKFEYEIAALGKIFSQDKKYFKEAKSQSWDGIKELFPTADATHLEKWVFESVLGIGNLFYFDYENQNWVEDDAGFGEKIYQSFREVLIRGRMRQVEESKVAEMRAAGYEVIETYRIAPRSPDAAAGVKKEKVYLVKYDEVKTDKIPPNVWAATNYVGEKRGKFGEFDPIDVHLPSRDANEVVVPYSWTIAGKGSSAARKQSNFRKINSMLDNPEAKRSENKSTKAGYHYGQFAGMMAIKLSNITLESDFQDTASSKPGETIGRPEAVSLTARLMNVWPFVLKYVEESMQKLAESGREITDEAIKEEMSNIVSDINPGMFFYRMFWTYLDFYGYPDETGTGRTFTDHMIINDDKNKIDWDKLPVSPTVTYGGALSHVLPIMQEMFDAQIDLRKMASFDRKTLRVNQVDVALNRKLAKIIRYIYDYMTTAHTTPGEVINLDADKKGVPEGYRNPEINENPTGGFKTIEVQAVDENGNEIEGMSTHFTTRIFDLMPIEKTQLLRWIPARYRERRNFSFQFTGPDETYQDPKTLENKQKLSKAEWKFKINIPLTAQERKSVKTGKDLEKSIISPETLLLREYFYRFIFAVSFLGDVLVGLSDEDRAFLSLAVGDQEALNKYRDGFYEGPIAMQFRKFEQGVFRAGGKMLSLVPILSSIKVNDDVGKIEAPRIIKRSIYEWDQIEELMLLLGHEINMEDLRDNFGELFTGKTPT